MIIIMIIVITIIIIVGANWGYNEGSFMLF